MSVNYIFDSVQNFILQDGHNFIYNLPVDPDGGAKPRRYSPFHQGDRIEIGETFLAKVREITLEEQPRKKKKKKRRKV